MTFPARRHSRIGYLVKFYNLCVPYIPYIPPPLHPSTPPPLRPSAPPPLRPSTPPPFRPSASPPLRPSAPPPLRPSAPPPLQPDSPTSLQLVSIPCRPVSEESSLRKRVVSSAYWEMLHAVSPIIMPLIRGCFCHDLGVMDIK